MDRKLAGHIKGLPLLSGAMLHFKRAPDMSTQQCATSPVAEASEVVLGTMNSEGLLTSDRWTETYGRLISSGIQENV